MYRFFFWEVVSRKQKLPGIHQQDLAGKDYTTIAHALGGMDGKDYLNSRKGSLFMYEQGVRLFELDLSRTSDGVWVCRHNWNDSMGQWDGNGKKVLTEKEFRQSKIYGKYTPMTLEDFFLLLKDYPDAYVLIDSKQYSLRNDQRTLEDYSDYVEIARNAGAGETLDRIIPEIYNEAMFPGTAMLFFSFLSIFTVAGVFCGRAGSISHPSVKKREFWQQQYTGSIGQKKRRRSLKNEISLYVYTVNDRDQARRYISQGAEGICTDFLTAEDLW